MEDQINQEQNKPETGEGTSMHVPESDVLGVNSPESTGTNKYLVITIVLGVALVLIAALVTYLLIVKGAERPLGADREPGAISREALRGAPENEIAMKLETIDELTAQRNFDAAIELGEATLPEIDDINEKADLQRDIALNHLNKGIGTGDKQDILAGMDILKQGHE